VLPPLDIHIKRESRQTAYRLKFIGRINQIGHGHSEIIGSSDLTRLSQQTSLEENFKQIFQQEQI
jgi:hypothetical protein